MCLRAVHSNASPGHGGARLARALVAALCAVLVVLVDELDVRREGAAKLGQAVLLGERVGALGSARVAWIDLGLPLAGLELVQRRREDAPLLDELLLRLFQT